MEELSSQSDVDGVAFCDRLLYLLDGINTTTDNPMENPPMSTKIRPISKKKKKQVTPPKTRNQPKSSNLPKTTTHTNSNKMKTKKATPPTTKFPPITTNPPVTKNLSERKSNEPMNMPPGFFDTDNIAQQKQDLERQKQPTTQ